MDRITRLQLYRLVAETLSFSRAASVSGAARSTVTKAVSDLERELGVRLLDRTTRTVALTPEGVAFLERGRDVIALFDEMQGMFWDRPNQVTGRVRISVPSRLGRSVVVPALPAFLDRHPGLEVDLSVSFRQEHLVPLGLDLVLRVGDKDDADVIAKHLGDAPLVTCAAPSYLARRGTPLRREDLAGHWVVGYPEPYTRRLWAFGGPPQDAVRLRSAVSATNADMYIASCVAGLGLGQMPAFDIREELAQGRLVKVLPDEDAGTVPVALVYAHRRNLTPRVRTVFDWLTQLIRRVLAD